MHNFSIQSEISSHHWTFLHGHCPRQMWRMCAKSNPQRQEWVRNRSSRKQTSRQPPMTMITIDNGEKLDHAWESHFPVRQHWKASWVGKLIILLMVNSRGEPNSFCAKVKRKRLRFSDKKSWMQEEVVSKEEEEEEVVFWKCAVSAFSRVLLNIGGSWLEFKMRGCQHLNKFGNNKQVSFS